ncbi:MAG: indoleamine 2,3-dioxygenase [Proteobacteria bacterium]|nr:indoleamine 2,3-dioxygenase [Pseudomonadota bacterium]
MLNLAKYDITPERGFLSTYNIDEVILPPLFAPIIEAGAMLSDYLSTGCVRKFLDKVPEIKVTEFLKVATEQQVRTAMVHYSFIVQAYIWGEKEPSDRLPRNLAVPYYEISQKLEQFPLLPYSAYVLDNWGMFDKTGPISLENIYMVQNFLKGLDENWFVMVHVAIEATAGRALSAIPALLEAAEKKDTQGVIKGLTTVRDTWKDINPIMGRMIESCDPYTYYTRVRPYIHGWKNNPALPQGVLYEGVDAFGGKHMEFRGQTGSQSSIVPTMDALFQIDHAMDPLREYLLELHQYRPIKHRMFIEDVQKHSKLRDFAQNSRNAEVVDLYNDCVSLVAAFRTMHLEYAASYINKQAAKDGTNSTEVGTGGTPFMKYLKKHRDESTKHLLEKPKAVA